MASGTPTWPIVGSVMLVASLAASLGAPADAAEWLTIQGTERGRAEPALRPFGFIRLVGEAIVASPVTGLESADLAPYNDRLAQFNVLAGSDTQSAFSVRFARVGARGVVPGTDGRVNVFGLAEFGSNAITRGRSAAITDASVSIETPWGPFVRVGQFKLPLADEVLQAVPSTHDLPGFSNVARTLLAERQISGGQLVGHGYGFRDIGVQLADSYAGRGLELSWAAMLSNGRMGGVDDNTAKDVSGRLQLSWLLDDRRRHPERDELSVYGWALRGERTIDAEQGATRLRAGAGIHARFDGWRLRVEGMLADGVLARQAPPFPGEPARVDPEGAARGLTALVAKRVIEPLEIDLAVHVLEIEPDGGPARRVSWEYVAAAQWFLGRRARLGLGVTWPQIDAPEAGADARAIVDTAGPKVTAMVTVLL